MRYIFPYYYNKGVLATVPAYPVGLLFAYTIRPGALFYWPGVAFTVAAMLHTVGAMCHYRTHGEEGYRLIRKDYSVVAATETSSSLALPQESHSQSHSGGNSRNNKHNQSQSLNQSAHQKSMLHTGSEPKTNTWYLDSIVGDSDSGLQGVTLSAYPMAADKVVESGPLKFITGDEEQKFGIE